MLAIDDSTSIDWAREMRGTASIAMTVMGRVASFSTRSGFRPGLIMLMRVAPSSIRAISMSLGALTLKITSLAHVSGLSAMVAPAST